MNENKGDMIQLNDKERLLNEIPREILIKIGDSSMSIEELSAYCEKEYHFDIEYHEDSDNYEELFYNSDLRSQMGFMEGENEARIFPEFYAKGWEDTYWKKLIEDNEIVEVVW